MSRQPRWLFLLRGGYWYSRSINNRDFWLTTEDSSKIINLWAFGQNRLLRFSEIMCSWRIKTINERFTSKNQDVTLTEKFKVFEWGYDSTLKPLYRRFSSNPHLIPLHVPGKRTEKWGLRSMMRGSGATADQAHSPVGSVQKAQKGNSLAWFCA